MINDGNLTTIIGAIAVCFTTTFFSQVIKTITIQ